jgi:hypothetical protein
MRDVEDEVGSDLSFLFLEEVPFVIVEEDVT